LSEFKESEHPRAEDGEFTSSGKNSLKPRDTVVFHPSDIGRGGPRLTDDVETELNPSHDEIVSMLRHSEEKNLRYAIDPDGNIYIWDANQADHRVIEGKIGSHKIPHMIEGDEQLDISKGEIFDLETLQIAEENQKLVMSGKYQKVKIENSIGGLPAITMEMGLENGKRLF
jgi:hypothetical protein